MADKALMWLLLLVVISVFPNALALQCYDCAREENPDAAEYCALPSPSSLGNNTIVNCSGQENGCTISKTILKSGSVTIFRRSCTELASCVNKCFDPDADGAVICISCCDEDLCNKGIGPKPQEQSGTTRMTTTWPLYMCVFGGYVLLLHF